MNINVEGYNASSYVEYGFILGHIYTVGVLSQADNNFSFSQRNINIDNYSFSSPEVTIFVHEITLNDKVIKLSWPLVLTIQYIEDIVTISNDDLNIYAVGNSMEHAIKEFNHHFFHFLTYYRNIPDDKLTGYAKRLKALFQKIVKEEKDANS
ncbi:hypothetical protein J7K93_13000 [bacterium]|nr:hypothetical protein [bacterium]